MNSTFPSILKRYSSALQIVERNRIRAILEELNLGKSGFLDEEKAAELGHGVQATHILMGAFTTLGDTMRLDVRMVDVKTGVIAFTHEVTGSKDDFFALEKQLIEEVHSKLALELMLFTGMAAINC